jgi:hypothetical protein
MKLHSQQQHHQIRRSASVSQLKPRQPKRPTAKQRKKPRRLGRRTKRRRRVASPVRSWSLKELGRRKSTLRPKHVVT